MHIAIQSYLECPDEFDEIKRIMKELLFNGANRDL
jgi:hypothetical protein